MTNVMTMRIIFKDGSKKEYVDLKEYGFPGGTMVYVKGKGKLSEKKNGREFGSHDFLCEWYKLEDVERIEMNDDFVFGNHQEKQDYIKNIMMGK